MLSDQKVLRLDVAMYDMLLMAVVESLGQVIDVPIHIYAYIVIVALYIMCIK